MYKTTVDTLVNGGYENLYSPDYTASQKQ